ncbi:NAD(P)H-dependent flavin oxidoreductase [Comamonas badia]|uniref:NAD(P)H-dependent flavin oxidoreductase n=1 Tax=Comamonas badia TaxID=265291 RepID=UPI00040A55B9|nr:nitronate monooxygenase [Comamonas badia]
MPEFHSLAPTPLCHLLGCRHPLILAGMGGVARAELAAAVSGFGGFGFLGMVREPLALIEREVAQVRRLTDQPFGVNLIPAGTARALLRSQVDLSIALGVTAVELFWDVDEWAIDRLRGAGITVVHQVGSARDALHAQAAGAHAVIAQGVEAGGHVWGRQPLVSLLDEVLGCVSIPVAAAGGLADGHDVGRVLAQGAQAAVLGTALMATTESFAHGVHKERLVSGKASDTLLTEDFHINWPPHAAVRVLPNAVTRGERGDPFTSAPQVIGEEEGRPIYLFSTDSPLRSMTGALETMALYAGKGIDRITAIVPAAERLQGILEGAAAHLRLVGDAAQPLASPVCYAAEVQHRERAPVVAALQALLADERAWVQQLFACRAQTPDAALRQRCGALLQVQTKACGLLVRCLRGLDAQPDPAQSRPATELQVPWQALMDLRPGLMQQWRVVASQLDGSDALACTEMMRLHEAAMA